MEDRFAYGLNPEKLGAVSAYLCDPATAPAEFLLVKSQYQAETGRAVERGALFFQIRQAFPPGEVTAEEANKLGYETAMRWTKGKYQFFVCTHTDRGHIHNHIYYNATAFDRSRKFHNFIGSSFAVRQQVHLAVSFSEILARINSAPVKKSQSFRLDDLIAAKEKELAKITRYKQSLYQDWKDGEITQQDSRTMKADYERQISSISDVLERLTAERAELANGVDSEHPALVAFKKHQNIETLNREILIDLVNYIKVYENGNISVKFKFADEFRRIAEYIEINISEIPAAAG